MEKAVTSLLVEKDKACIWHPFTQMLNQRDPIAIVKGRGPYLISEDGKKYLDGISSWCVNLHGHAHPYIADKIKEQLDNLEHVIFAGFTHAPAVHLAERILFLLPGQFSKIFYTDNGSTSVEAALKIALQYWFNKNPLTKKTKIICFKGSYHGDTFGAMSASGKNPFTRPFWSHLFEVDAIDPPLNGFEEKSLIQLKNILKRDDAACFIFEPLILGIGGMIVYSSQGLDEMLKISRENHVLLIADEVMTGFGRTGPLFACEELVEKPDIICLSKGLTGGFLPLGITACSEDIYQAFLSSDLCKAFLHGHSYTANPLACASALASLDLLENEHCTLQREKIALSHEKFCRKYKGHPKLKRCESLGTILIVEYKTLENKAYFDSFRNRLYDFFLDKGIIVRPLGNVLYLMPPYCIAQDELAFIYETIILTLEDFS